MGAGPLIVSFIAIVIIAAGSAVAFVLYRNMLREAKNYERGLKMVPLLIHLPPTSEDVNSSNRDERDLTEEVLSQAQVMYNIISSTATKGFKSKVYGQRHISFEIVAHGGLVHYYAVVPLVLVDVIRQAVAAAYPSARLEEVSDTNIFSKVGKMSGTIGGEFTLKKSFVYPISTYQESKRDASRALLNALSSASREDGIGVQFLLRPAYDGWSKASESHIDSMKKNKGKKKGFGGVAPMDIMEALWKPPENNEKDGGSSSEDKQLTSLEQAEVDAISEKARYPAYEVLVRVVISSNTAARSQVLLKNIIAAFSLFDSPRNNGFKFSLTRNVEEMTTAYIMRFFPQETRSNILNSVEMATLFHLPGANAIPTSQVKRQMSKQVDGPTDVLDEGLLIGYNEFRGVKKPIRIGTKDRRRHVYIIGQTGVGKSVLQENMAYQDMMDGRGFAFIDPHGDLVESLLGKVPKERVEDIIYFNPADMTNPIGLNMFEFDTPDQKDFLVQEAINMLYGLYDPGHTGIVGPRLEHIFRNCALLLMSDPAGGTFIDVPKCLIDPEFVKSKLKYVKDQQVIDFWTKEFPASQRSNEAGEVISWVVSKFGPFISNDAMRNIIGQTKSGFNLREIMDNNKILLVNLSKGKMGELNSKLLGIIFVMKFQAAAMSRADIPEDQRVDFSLYVDEFQNFATDSFESILSEARKYKLSLIMGNQFMTQLTDKIREAIIGNVGTVISGRIGVTDAELMVKKFQPTFDVDDLAKLPNFQSITSVMINNVPSAPFSMNWIPPMGQVNNQLRDALVRLSAAKYGRPRAVVEKEIFDRIRGSVQPKTSPSQLAPSANQKASGGSSFLDEWLAKRQQLGGKPASNSTVRPVNSQAPQTSSQIQNPQGRPGVVNNAPSNINSVNATASNLDSKQQSQPSAIDSAVVNRTNVSMTTNNNPVSSVNVKPNQPVVKNRLDLRNGDDDDSEVMISLR
ncbi:type IV secretory system conjugative DNA transfer family protein [Candidatus Nanosynbacter sp. TM7-057]|uniref:type IV secretory system conjugative DNA transfer family protein n=1 Tax=Candidatus Nanosynbacter sp. TM7-057 TaxID=2902630 RepID=UPI001FB5B6DB|nr:type IV secretory system conjugative DNA transfer family protein [Candidatus Nanosynbacter sp. TM7-057]MCJ1964655.1 TraM recognition domain-containing protein [Candidatus Nanosynbacter sp. TM7-057]